MPITDTVPPSSLRAAAAAEWQQRGGRWTRVREVLCEVIEQQTAPFTAESLLPIARAVDHGISMASVYRTLGDLAEFGVLHESRGRDNEKCYSVIATDDRPAVQCAATVVCRDCGRLHPLKDSCLVMREGPAAKQAGFNLRKLDLRMEADCEAFKNTGHCDHAPPRRESS